MRLSTFCGLHRDTEQLGSLKHSPGDHILKTILKLVTVEADECDRSDTKERKINFKNDLKARVGNDPLWLDNIEAWIIFYFLIALLALLIFIYP
jgi:hypothetical protein